MKKTKIINRPNLRIQAKRDIDTESISRKKFDIEEKYKLPLYKKLNFFVRTYGCQANIIDSQIISKILTELEFKPANDIKNADLVILNTCAIRQNAEDKVYGEIGFLAKLRKNNPNFRLGVSGCMPQQEVTVNRLKEDKKVDLVFGVHNIDELPKYIYEIYKGNQKIISVKFKNDN